MRFFVRLSVALAALTLGAILVFLGWFACPLLISGEGATLLSLQWDPTAGIYGLVPMIVGTLGIALMAALLGGVLALGIALGLEAIPKGQRRDILYRTLMVLGSIPTVVYGLVGVLVLIPWVRSIWMESSGMSLIAAGGMLSLVITPTMALFFYDSLRSAPASYRQIVAALGGERIQYQLRILLPYRWRSLLSGWVLGLGRALGDTMIALMLSGNAVQIPRHPGDAVRTLTAHIGLLFAGDFDSSAFRSIFASGLILFGLTMVLLGVAQWLRRGDAAY
jgi:phosphate transport system permease protein